MWNYPLFFFFVKLLSIYISKYHSNEREEHLILGQKNIKLVLMSKIKMWTQDQDEIVV